MLPVDAVLPELTGHLEKTPNVVLVADPGAGKTTRVPPALLPASWRDDGRIIVLEPRRLAARAAARRIAASMSEGVGDTVGYRVRMESRVSRKTRIEFVTEGVFTRMILADPMLDGIAAVIFDEFHERSLDADMGLAFALEAQEALRPDLRLIVMSATLDDTRVARLLGDAPIVRSPGGMFPVETVYLPRDANTRIEDAASDAIKKALAGETGSILTFLPGQGEILRTAARLEGALSEEVDLCPLYGALTPQEQDRAIRPADTGRRKVVLATSIAESSLTIEGVRVVIDSGLARKPQFEPALGLTRLETKRVSKASADQRRGRAGRIEPGVCYRLWAEGQTSALRPFDRPEILEADLSNLVLDLAAWGVADPDVLNWLDPPPRPAWSEAVALLQGIDALTESGAITDEGRDLSRLPLHPRLAHMVLHAAQDGQAPLAADIAVLIVERGIGGRDTDLRERLRRLRHDKGRTIEARKLADRWANLAGGGGEGSGSLENAGSLLATAYPDRVAKARGTDGAYLLANGRGAVLDPADPLAGENFLAVAELQGAARNAKILLAAPLSIAVIEELFAAHIEFRTEIDFDAASKSVRARRRRVYGKLILDERAAANPDPRRMAEALLAGLARMGLQYLPWTPAIERKRSRLAFLAARVPGDWPDVSDQSMSGSLSGWLGPFIAGKTALSMISADDLNAALDNLVGHRRQFEFDRLAPPSIALPTGRDAPIDYAAEAGPTLSVKPQELYGMTAHPMLAGNEPLVIELLSPAGRPIQTTRDLPGFWKGSWADVRRDMRGRYPKHDWPEDPANAQPSRGAKKRK